MGIKIIQNQGEFSSLEKEWNDLLENSASHVPFLRHEYLTSWWSTLGGGEWQAGDLAIHLEINDQAQIEGIAPFFFHNERLMFLGSYEISDYLDFIYSDTKPDAFLSRLFNHLAQDSNFKWKKIDLYNINQKSPTLQAATAAAAEQGWEVISEKIQPAPCLTLPDSWERYLDLLDSRYRHEIERKIRRAESYFLPVSWYIVEDQKNLEAEMEDFLELMAYNQDKANFLTDLMATQMKKSVQEAFQSGWLQLAFLTVGDVKAAGYLNFDFDNQIWVYNSGLNPMFENISPGWVLLCYLIQWSIDHKRTALDFMRGDEPYKYQFGGKDRQLYRLQILRG
jgi:CelD/BcsL family acetyltransferase involved in cellulose biosynthesis